jgi:hypothetical protein
LMTNSVFPDLGELAMFYDIIFFLSFS